MSQTKRVALLQSNYLPWKGYFDLINSVDEFIFYDDVQYTKNDWRNRNQIKTKRGVEWISIPCGSNLNRLINEVEINDKKWKNAHWSKIIKSYRQAPFFKRYEYFFEDFYLKDDQTNLSELNQYLITKISRDFLSSRTVFDDSRRFCNSDLASNDRVLDIVKKAGATTYVSGPSAKNYLMESDFLASGITVEWIDYGGYPEYEQAHPPFTHAVSIIDLLFSVGSDAPAFMKSFK